MTCMLKYRLLSMYAICDVQVLRNLAGASWAESFPATGRRNHIFAHIEREELPGEVHRGHSTEYLYEPLSL